MVLLFHNQDGAAAAKTLQETLRAEFPLANELLIAGVVDMQASPSFLRRVAELAMGTAYRDAARQLPAGVDPAEYVVILPDWTGRVYAGFGIADGGRAPVAFLVDHEWRNHGPFREPGLAQETLAAARRVLRP